MLELNRLYHMDCMEGMAQFPDKYFGAIITDPPYGIDFQSARRIKSFRKHKILNDKQPFTEWIRLAYNKMKDEAYLISFYRWDVQEEFLGAIKNAGFKVCGQIVWDKIIHGMGDLTGSIAPQHELAIFATKGKYIFPGKRPKSIYREMRVNADQMIHPNEKPKNLILRLLRDFGIYTPICEPFAGSGVMPLICENLKIDWIAFEIDKDYYEAASKRIEVYKAQLKLF